MRRSAYVGLIALFFFLLAAAGLVFVFLEGLGGGSADVPGRAYLEVRLSGPVEEIAPTDSLASVLLGGRPLTMRDLWANMRKAKVDARIQAVLFRVGALQCDWAKANEMREMILDFRRSGKKAVAFIEEAPDCDLEYFAVTACDRIVLHPLGWLGINGLGGYVPFFKGALDKLGVKAEFEHVEEYKTAYNMFTEKGFTPPHREEMESYYGDIFDQYVAAAAKARGKTEAEFRALVDRGFFQGAGAKEAGLVDDCLYEDEVEGLLAKDGRPLARVRFDDYTRVRPSSVGLETGRNKVAVIYAVGTIVSGESLAPLMGGSTVARWIRAARQDASAKAIVLRVDSPGGSSVGSDVVWREVDLARKEKPVIVSMSDVAGSGGYWIAMGATKIVAQPQTLTGSIGVLAGKFSVDGLLAKLGVSAERLVFGERADAFSPFRPFTGEERKVLKDEILWTYERFLAKAGEGRGLERDEVDAVGRGRIWTGRQARERRLVDELGGLTMALGLAKKEAGIDAGEEVRLDVWPRKRTFWQSLVSRPGLGLDLKTAAGRGRVLETLRLLDRPGIWAVMPLWTSPQ
ncbi:MAG TPA: signal peptide peptidase SppA [Candidatus Aminicenantes bacterium]|nr:signal peptide peptidase SppA [Candidatus Aminicenantes bacterium]